MKRKGVVKIIIPVLILLFCSGLSAQTVPAGIHYQAVARQNSDGREMANADISVRFSILSGNPDGPVVYQEIHSDVRTSNYGVFSLIIGGGTYSSGTAQSFQEIQWESAAHWVKVEVKFSNDYLDMGTMQFLAVPYALYAKKSLEAGPQGPQGPQGLQGPQGIQGLKGDAGDPATDNQKLSFDGANLSISPNGNTVNLSTLSVPHSLTLLGDSLTILGGNGVSLKDYRQNLNFNSGNNILYISGGLSTDLSPIKQNLSLAGNTLTITNIASPTPIDLSKYLQSLSFNQTTNRLTISDVAGDVDLTPLKNDADADPGNEIQDLSISGNELSITGKTSPTKVNLGVYLDNTDNQTLNYNPSNYTLSLTNGGSAVLGSIIAFRARKTTSDTGLSIVTDYDFISGTIDYNDSNAYDGITGIFMAPATGIYTFNVNYTSTGSGDGRSLKIFLNGGLYDVLNSGISQNTSLTRSVTMKLTVGDRVKVIINTGLSSESGIGSFSGFRIY